MIDDEAYNLNVIESMLKILNLKNVDVIVDYCLGAMDAIKKIKESFSAS